MALKIGFTYDLKTDYQSDPDDSPDKYAEFDIEETLLEIEQGLKLHGDEIIRIGHAKKLIEKITSGERWDIVFNICEGLNTRNRESQVPAILDLYEIPYTGSDALTMGLTLDKVLAKKLAGYHGIKTPEFIIIHSTNDIDKHKKWLSEHFPVIVKPLYEGTSKGLDKESLCKDLNQLKIRVEWLINTYHQSVLVEQFIKGYEFTVAVVGNSPPEVLPPVQVGITGKTDLGEEFYTHAMVESSDIQYLCPVEIDPKLDKKMREVAGDVYKIVGCRDLGRVDFRVDYDLVPYFLECNPLPHLGSADVFPLVAKATGRTYEELIYFVLESALKRIRCQS